MKRNDFFSYFQNIGKSIMLPISVLPIAALLLRLGQEDIYTFLASKQDNIPAWFSAIASGGQAIFDNLAIIFSLGVAIGFSKNNKGIASLSAGVGFFIMSGVIVALGKPYFNNPNIDIAIARNIYFVDIAAVQKKFIIGGIIIGIIAGYISDKFNNIKLSSYLMFFSGKRLIPIITGLVCFILGYLFYFIWPMVQKEINNFGSDLIGLGAFGLFLYGFFNRLLIVTGLHHILNSYLWFEYGEYTDNRGDIIKGDLNRYFAGDPEAGIFMSGFFPVMMFGLPAIALAIYFTSKKEKKTETGSIMLSVAATSFFTGITEPLEFSFMFISPILYFAHSILTGLSLALCGSLGIKHGFSFSAGFIDFFLNIKTDNIGKANQNFINSSPWFLLIIGLLFFFIYFFISLFLISITNLKSSKKNNEVKQKIENINKHLQVDNRIKEFNEALGGINNLKDISSCITRLRLVINNKSIINEVKLIDLGARGFVYPLSNTMQIILGIEAEEIADGLIELKKSHK